VKCEKCGKEIPKDSRFCSACGAEIKNAVRSKSNKKKSLNGIKRILGLLLVFISVSLATVVTVSTVITKYIAPLPTAKTADARNSANSTSSTTFETQTENPEDEGDTTQEPAYSERTPGEIFMDSYGGDYSDEARERVMSYINDQALKDEEVKAKIDQYIQAYGEKYGYNGYRGPNLLCVDEQHTYFLNFITGYDFKYVPREKGGEQFAKFIIINTNLTYNGGNTILPYADRDLVIIVDLYKGALEKNKLEYDFDMLFVNDQYGQTMLSLTKGEILSGMHYEQ
jgi:predicted nucleic acid-binding Zn ribbon protein